MKINLPTSNRSKAILFVGVFIIIGIFVIIFARAAEPNTITEAEDGQLVGNAALCVNDHASASEGKSVQFNSGLRSASIPLPACGIYTGVIRDTRAGETRFTTMENAESAQIDGSVEGGIGRKYDSDRQFYNWGNTLIADLKTDTDPAKEGYLTWTSKQGRYPIINLSARNNSARATSTGKTFTDWASISSGTEDANYLNPMADQLKTWNRPAFFIFHHEPDTAACDNGKSPCAGNAADFVAAWRHIHDLFASRGVTNLTYMWDVVPYTAENKLGYMNQLYPDNCTLYPSSQCGNYADWIATTPFNIYQTACNWRQLKDIVQPFYDWAKNLNKPIALPAYGTGEWEQVFRDPVGNPNHPEYDACLNWTTDHTKKAEWIANAQKDVPKEFPMIKLMAYFDVSSAGVGSLHPVDNTVNSSAEAYTAYKALVNDPVMNTRNF